MTKKYIFLFLLITGFAWTQEDQLPSWREGDSKKAILEFVRKATDPKSTEYVLPEDRIATFDQDGTLWVEHPLYTQAMFALDRVKKMSSLHPEWKNEEPFKAILTDDKLAISTFDEHDWALIIAATHADMSVESFLHVVQEWLAASKHPRFNQPYTKLIYQPMMEVMNYLRNNGFMVYIVSGGGQEFIRAYAQQIYNLPPNQIIGSSITTKYENQPNGIPLLMRLPKVFFICNYGGKPVAINLIIGKKPSAAFGNSTGDKEMLEWTQANQRSKLMMLVLHDDPEREYAYGPAMGLPNTSVGTFSAQLLADAKQRNWFVISMKNDWNRIFAFEK